MSLARQTIVVVSTVSSHTDLRILRSLLDEIIVLGVKATWLHVTCGWVSWLSFLVSGWNLLISINTIHILSNNLILTCKWLLLGLLLRCQSATSWSSVGTVLLSVVYFLAVDVAVEGVVLASANTHLTLTQMLTILIKTLVRISNLLFLSHGLLLVTEIHGLLFCLWFAWLGIWFGKSGLLITYAILKQNTLFVWDGVLNWVSFLIVAERWSCILSCTTWTYGIIILSIQSSLQSTFMHLISRIALWLLIRVSYVLLELRIILILGRNLLHWLLGILVVVWV